MILPKITGVSTDTGNSEDTLAKKYALTQYILLLTSLRNTGLSSGKIKITFWIALKAMVIVQKKRAPFLFWTPLDVPSTPWNRIIAKAAVRIVTISFT